MEQIFCTVFDLSENTQGKQKLHPCNFLDVENITVTIDEVEIPPQVTTYMCQFMELPSDGDYHVIAAEPMLDNEFLPHHMILYACLDEDGKVVV